MTTKAHTTLTLGDLIANLFDEAAGYSRDPREVAAIATRAVQRILRRQRRAIVWVVANSAEKLSA